MTRLRRLLLPRRRPASVLPVAILCGLAFLVGAAAPLPAQDVVKSTLPVEIRPGDHISIIGNTLADRMQHDGWLETYLQSRFPKHQLVVRNLGFSGDEVAGYTDPPDPNRRMRSMDFGTADQWPAGNAPTPQPGKLKDHTAP